MSDTFTRLLPTALFCSHLLFAGTAAAQFADYIRSGRPGESIGTYTVGAKTLQGQHGFSFRARDLNGRVTRTIASSNVLRLGLTEDFEVSGVLRLQRDDRSDFGGANSAGVSSAQLGVRYNVTSESAHVPSVAIQSRLLLNGALSEEYEREAVGLTTIVSAGKGITDRLGVTANLGVTHDGNTPGITSFYALALGFSASPKWEFFVEAYGQLDDIDLNFDAGLGYYISPNLKLDLSAGPQGFGQFEGDPVGLQSDYFVSGGVSWRANWRN